MGCRRRKRHSLPPAQAALITAGGGAIPAPVNGHALIDTGASLTCIDDGIARQLGLRQIGSTNVNTPSGTGIVQAQYLVETHLVGYGPNLWTMTGATLAAQGIVALIGTDVLQNCVLVFDGKAGHFSLAF